jgi:GNAT superfamily N-acetyltransferase
MPIDLRAANLRSDKTLLIETLRLHLTPSGDERRYEWLYRNNPTGEAKAWIASDRGNRTVVGVAAAFPRRLWAYGREVSAYVLGDFCTHPAYRSLGPGVQLQRACLSVVEEGPAQICYDFPSESMLSIYRRLKIPVLTQMVRMAKLFSVDRKVARLVRVPIVARGLSTLGNLALSLMDRAPKQTGNWTIEFHQGEFGEEFSQLARDNSRLWTFHLVRSAEYLNWRFRLDPSGSHEVLTARAEGRLLGYSIFTHREQDGYLEDFCALPIKGLAEALLADTARILKHRGAVAVSIYILEGHPWVNDIKKMSFVSRECCPVVVFAPRLKTPELSNVSNWFLMQGDRDV